MVGSKNTSILWGLFLLRFGLGAGVALWGVDKLVAPEHTVKMLSTLYSIDISASIAIIAGALELVLGLLIVMGMYKTITYGAGLVLNSISTLVVYYNLITPFGANHSHIDAIPVLFGFLALFLLRDFDTKLSLGKRKSLFS